jgi:hypothetical protein
MHIVNEILAFFREGFHHVNAIQGLIIALVAAIIMPRWRRLLPTAFIATVVHILADMLVPVIARHAAFHLPDFLSLGFWRFVATLFLGYIVVIAVFYFMKWVVVGGRRR